MSFTTPRTWTYGETVTEAQLNEQLRDNMNALWTGTTAGDMDYYTSNATKTRLAGGTANAGVVLRMGTAGTAPEYGGVVTYRQGGSATNWSTTGTVNYTPTKSVIQTGAFNIPEFNTTYGKGTIIFPTPFSRIPLVFTENIDTSKVFTRPNYSAVTTTYAEVVYNVEEGVTDPNGLDIAWIAIGEL